ncbi:MAG: hypothetical protein WC659_04660 [Patescibacteria group bacterium]
MRKYIFLSILTLGIILFTGCSQRQADQNKPISSTPTAQNSAPSAAGENNGGQPIADESQNINQGADDAGIIVYDNAQYGFTLTLSNTWSGYATKNRTLDWGSFGISDSIDFGFPTQDSLFNISMHTKSQWQQIKSEEDPAPTYLGESGEYVFGYSSSQGAINETMVARMREIEDIVKTFKIADTTSAWKSYRNLGVSIKYPNDGSYTVETPENNYFIITQNHPGNRFHVRTTGSDSVEGAYFTFNETINNQEFRKFKYVGMGSGYGYMIKHNGINYIFETTLGPVNSVFDLMMTTVVFD